MAGHLSRSLSAVDWNANVAEFLSNDADVQRFEACNSRLAVWSKQFESVDGKNPALSFIREMQSAGHSVPALASLALYKQSAAGMRTVLESALYYSYFRVHPVELATLVRETSYYVRKSEVIDFHLRHTVGFSDRWRAIGLNGRLDEWYGRASSIIHGQIPGKWTVHAALAKTGHRTGMVSEVVAMFEKCEEIVHHFFLCTLGQEMWSDFSSGARGALLKGVAGPTKAAIGLTSA